MTKVISVTHTFIHSEFKKGGKSAAGGLACSLLLCRIQQREHAPVAMSRQLDSASDAASSIGGSDAGSEAGKSEAGSQVADDGGDLLKESKFSFKVRRRYSHALQLKVSLTTRMSKSEPC